MEDADGNAIIDGNHIGNVNPVRYRGYYYDSETGFYHVSLRYYDPEVGRFISADDPEILFEDQDNILENNLYIYCFNNPVNMADPDGRFARYASKAAVYGGFALGGVAGTALVIIGGVLFVYYSGKLIKKVFHIFKNIGLQKMVQKRNRMINILSRVQEENLKRRNRKKDGKVENRRWKDDKNIERML